MASRNKLFKHLAVCERSDEQIRPERNNSQLILIGYERDGAYAERAICDAYEVLLNRPISVITRASRPNDSAAAPEASCSAVVDVLRVGYKAVDTITVDALREALSSDQDITIHAVATVPSGVASLHASQDATQVSTQYVLPVSWLGVELPQLEEGLLSAIGAGKRRHDSNVLMFHFENLNFVAAAHGLDYDGRDGHPTKECEVCAAHPISAYRALFQRVKSILHGITEGTKNTSRGRKNPSFNGATSRAWHNFSNGHWAPQAMGARKSLDKCLGVSMIGSDDDLCLVLEFKGMPISFKAKAVFVFHPFSHISFCSRLRLFPTASPPP